MAKSAEQKRREKIIIGVSVAAGALLLAALAFIIVRRMRRSRRGALVTNAALAAGAELTPEDRAIRLQQAADAFTAQVQARSGPIRKDRAARKIAQFFRKVSYRPGDGCPSDSLGRGEHCPLEYPCLQKDTIYGDYICTNRVGARRPLSRGSSGF